MKIRYVMVWLVGQRGKAVKKVAKQDRPSAHRTFQIGGLEKYNRLLEKTFWNSADKKQRQKQQMRKNASAIATTRYSSGEEFNIVTNDTRRRTKQMLEPSR